MSLKIRQPGERLVFLLEPNNKYDLSDLNRFGAVIYLFENNEHKPSVWSNAFIEECLSRMDKYGYHSEIDYFAAVGQQVPLILLATHLVSSYDTVNLLLFDARGSEYVHKAVI